MAYNLNFCETTAENIKKKICSWVSELFGTEKCFWYLENEKRFCRQGSSKRFMEEGEIKPTFIMFLLCAKYHARQFLYFSELHF